MPPRAGVSEAQVGKDLLPSSCGNWPDFIPFRLLDFSLLPTVVGCQPPVSCHRSLSIRQLITQQVPLPKLQREQALARKAEVTALCDAIRGVAAFAAFYWLEESHRFCPHSMGGIPQRCDSLEARLMGPFRVCPTQGSANFCQSLERTHFRLAS